MFGWLAIRNIKIFILNFKFQAFRNSPGNSGIQIPQPVYDDQNFLDGRPRKLISIRRNPGEPE